MRLLLARRCILSACASCSALGRRRFFCLVVLYIHRLRMPKLNVNSYILARFSRLRRIFSIFWGKYPRTLSGTSAFGLVPLNKKSRQRRRALPEYFEMIPNTMQKRYLSGWRREAEGRCAAGGVYRIKFLACKRQRADTTKLCAFFR